MLFMWLPLTMFESSSELPAGAPNDTVSYIHLLSSALALTDFSGTRSWIFKLAQPNHPTIDASDLLLILNSGRYAILEESGGGYMYLLSSLDACSGYRLTPTNLTQIVFLDGRRNPTWGRVDSSYFCWRYP